MVNSLKKFIVTTVLNDEDRRTIIELEHQHRKLLRNLEACSPTEVNKQIKAWKAEAELNPSRFDELTQKIADYPDKALKIYRSDKAAQAAFIENELTPFNDRLKTKIKTTLIEALKEEEKLDYARFRKYRAEFEDPLIESLKSEIESLDAFQGNLAKKILNDNPEFSLGAI